MKPTYPLDIEALHSAVSEWLPGNPDNNSLVRPNQETVQLYLQIIEYGFECNLIPRMARLVGSYARGGSGAYHLVLGIDYQGVMFDARDHNPFEITERYCEKIGVEWNWGDPIDMAIGHQMLYHLIETARTIPNLGMARSIDETFSVMEGNFMDDNTPQANSEKTGSGRL